MAAKKETPEPPYPAALGDNWRNPVTGKLWGFREHDGDNVWIRIAEDDKSRLDHPDEQLALMASEDIAREAAEPFTQAAYNQMIANLDAIMNVMTTEFGKTEAEAQAWLQSFITGHYFPVWRAMNTKDTGHDPRPQAQPPA